MINLTTSSIVAYNFSAFNKSLKFVTNNLSFDNASYASLAASINAFDSAVYATVPIALINSITYQTSASNKSS